jgi:phage gpG-like protein
MTKFGRDTRVKLLGSEVVFRLQNNAIDDYRRRLSEFGRKVSDLSPVFKDFGTYMLRSIDRNFAAQGRPRRWQALAASTVRQRLAQGYGAAPILQRTRKLRTSFKVKYTKTTMSITNTARSKRGFPYFQVHQDGGKRIPQRVMVTLLQQDRTQFTKLYRKHIGVE